MNRTKLYEWLPVIEATPSDEVLVATRVDHPRRGRIPCPAAPLVIGSLTRRGIRVRSGPLIADDGPRPADLRVVSYQERDGRAIGLGVVTHPGNAPLTKLVEDAVAAWGGVLRTRRVIVEREDPAIFPLLRGPHPDQLCYEQADRSATIRAIAEESDLILVCGQPGTTDTEEIAAMSTTRARAVHIIDSVSAIRPEYLAVGRTVGVVTSVTAQRGLRDTVVIALSGLGPVSVLHRTPRASAMENAQMRLPSPA